MTDSDNIESTSAAVGLDNDANPPARLELLSVYAKDISFEAPSLPKVILERPSQNPSNHIDFRIKHRVLNEDQGLTEVKLGVTVTCTLEDETLYLAEVEQCGLFLIQHHDADTLEKSLDIMCPEILLPFAREQIASLIAKGSFPPFLIAPINFQQAHLEKVQQRADRQAASDGDAQS